MSEYLLKDVDRVQDRVGNQQDIHWAIELSFI